MAIVLIALIFVATYLLMSYFRGLFLTATTAALQATTLKICYLRNG